MDIGSVTDTLFSRANPAVKALSTIMAFTLFSYGILTTTPTSIARAESQKEKKVDNKKPKACTGAIITVEPGASYESVADFYAAPFGHDTTAGKDVKNILSEYFKGQGIDPVKEVNGQKPADFCIGDSLSKYYTLDGTPKIPGIKDLTDKMDALTEIALLQYLSGIEKSAVDFVNRKIDEDRADDNVLNRRADVEKAYTKFKTSFITISGIPGKDPALKDAVKRIDDNVSDAINKAYNGKKGLEMVVKKDKVGEEKSDKFEIPKDYNSAAFIGFLYSTKTRSGIDGGLSGYPDVRKETYHYKTATFKERSMDVFFVSGDADYFNKGQRIAEVRYDQNGKVIDINDSSRIEGRGALFNAEMLTPLRVTNTSIEKGQWMVNTETILKTIVWLGLGYAAAELSNGSSNGGDNNNNQQQQPQQPPPGPHPGN